MDAEGVAELVADVRPDACIHLAAASAVAESFADPDTAWWANVDGTRALAAALMRHAPECRLPSRSTVSSAPMAASSGFAIMRSSSVTPTGRRCTGRV